MGGASRREDVRGQRLGEAHGMDGHSLTRAHTQLTRLGGEREKEGKQQVYIIWIGKIIHDISVFQLFTVFFLFPRFGPKNSLRYHCFVLCYM